MESLSTVDLLVLTSLYQLLFILQTIFTFYETSYLNVEINYSEHSLSISVPQFKHLAYASRGIMICAQNVIMLIVVMLSDIKLIFAMLMIVMLNVVMENVVNDKGHGAI
jgi:hypothetical protein